MLDLEDSTVTYTAVSSPFRGPPSPDYLSWPEEQNRHHLYHSIFLSRYTQEDPEEDDDEDPEEDPADYPTDKDDDDDKERGGAHQRRVAFSMIYHAPSAEETEPFETDESAATPPQHPAYRATARISIRAQTPVLLPFDTEAAATSTYILAPRSGILPSETPPLGTPPLLPIPLPTPSPPLLLPSTDCRAGVSEATLPTEGCRADYGFVGTLDDEIRRDPMRYDTNEIYGRLDDAHDDRLLMSSRLNTLFRDRRAHAHIALLMEREARLSREAWGWSMDASDLARSEVMALHTQVVAQQSEIAALRVADRTRQAQLAKTLRLMSTLQTQPLRNESCDRSSSSTSAQPQAFEIGERSQCLPKGHQYLKHQPRLKLIRKLVADSVTTALQHKLLQWKMLTIPIGTPRKRSSLFSRSNCTEDWKVKFATGTLTEEALSCPKDGRRILPSDCDWNDALRHTTEGKKLSELMLPLQLKIMGIVETVPYVINALCITQDLTLLSVILATRSPVLWVEIGESSLTGLELLSCVHDTFHVSNLEKKCLADASLHVPLDEIKVDKTLLFVEELVENSVREVKRLKCSRMVVVKVLMSLLDDGRGSGSWMFLFVWSGYAAMRTLLWAGKIIDSKILMKVCWNSKRGPEFTWEREDYMKSKYPQLFVGRSDESTS
ncbi:hypothetical protein Tco_1144882 [Tanacetum coccineum]